MQIIVNAAAILTLIVQTCHSTVISKFSPKMSSKENIIPLLNRFKELPLVKQRAVASVVGAAVADAATRPFHWLYDRKKLEDTVGDQNPEFWPTSMSPFYTIPTGRRSCYNDMGYVMLRSLSSPSYKENDTLLFDKNKYIESLCELFSPGSEYDQAMKRRLEAYDPAKRLEDRQPVEGPWQQGAVTYFLKKHNVGEESDGNPESKETDGLCSSLPLIARLSVKDISEEDFLQTIQSSASILASNPFAMKHALASSRILKHLIQGGGGGGEGGGSIIDQETLITLAFKGMNEDTDLTSEINQVLEAYTKNEHYSEACERFGKACAYPGSFMGSFLALLHSSSSTAESTRLNYITAIRKIIKVGGCNCSRANFVGACLGAIHGFQEVPFVHETTTSSESTSTCASGVQNGIPTEWILQTDKGLEIFELALNNIGGE